MSFLLDCTLRDGGYYTNWKFNDSKIREYLDAINIAGIDAVEIGYRTINSDKYLGPYAYSPESLIKALKVPKKLKVSVMINSSDILNQGSAIDSINKMFPFLCNDSLVDIVRIASNIGDLVYLENAIKLLKNKGYTVCLNLMHITQFAENLDLLPASFNNLSMDVFYMGDSTGSLTPDKLKKLISSLKNKWNGEIGIHAHDNQGMALQNTILAEKCGANWLDSTVLGMGRGPGNAKTEQLIIEMNKNDLNIRNLVKLQESINSYFQPLLEKYKWGSNTYYYLSGKYQIHPSFITAMANDGRYEPLDILSLIDNIRYKETRFFTDEKLLNAKNHYNKSSPGNWSPEKKIKGRNILLLAPGGSLKDMQETIEIFIKNRNCIVLALNYNIGIDKKLIDFFVAIDPFRITLDIPSYCKNDIPLITPVSLLPEFIKNDIPNDKLLDFGISINDSDFHFFKTGCKIPNGLSLPYALSIANSGKAKFIFMAGFDGYPVGDSRNKDVENTLQKYLNLKEKIDICSITETSYKHLPSKSIYAPQ